MDETLLKCLTEDSDEQDPLTLRLFENVIYTFPQQGKILRTQDLEIPGIEGARPLTIYLPPDFEEHANKYYPLAYLFDGQNLYQDQPHGPNGWQLHRVLDERWLRGLSVPIVIGVHHGPKRDEELSPWPVEGQTARGAQLLAWLVDELHPRLCQCLPVLGDAENTLLGGSSLGGLLALYGSFRYNHVFGRAMAMSPSLWVGEGALYDFIAKTADLCSPETFRLYIDAGCREGEADCSADPQALGKAPVEDADRLVQVLEARGLIRDQHFRWIADPQGEHSEDHWHKRLPLALDFHYGACIEPCQQGPLLDTAA